MGKKRQKIFSNKIKCNHCGDVIESRTVHEYVECSCGMVFVDGGHEYLRRGFKNDENDFFDLSVVAIEV